VDISLAGMLCINNVCAFLPVAAVAWYLGEPQLWASLLQAATAKDYLLVFSSCILGVAVGWSIILVQQRVTATAMQMLSNMNRLAIIVGGVLFVGETYTHPALLGLVLAFGGGSWFAVARTTSAAGVQTHGQKDEGLSGLNGHANGHSNTHTNGYAHANGHGHGNGTRNGSEALTKLAGAALWNRLPSVVSFSKLDDEPIEHPQRSSPFSRSPPSSAQKQKRTHPHTLI